MPEPRPVLFVVGAGMIGRAIVRAAAADYRVCVVDADPGMAALLPPQVNLVVAPVESLDAVPPADVVVWAAGVLGPQLDGDPDAAMRTELAFSRFTDLVEQHPPRRLLLISSLAVYGGQQRPSESTPVRPASAYGCHKVRLEEIATRWAERTSIDLTVVRCCGVVGPVREPGGGWMQASLRDFIMGGCRETSLMERLRGQELLHADDVAHLVMQAAGSPTALPAVLNVGSGVVLRELADRDPPAGLDWTKAREELGYYPHHQTIREIMQAIMQDQSIASDARSGGPRTLILAGSHRIGAYSTALAHAVEELLLRQGHEVDLVEIAKLDLPLHNPADHHNPEGSADSRVRDFAARVRAATSFVWITPIYHGSFSSGFKNALDNINIPLMEGKPVAVMAHGGGRFGGSVLDHLRTIVVNLHARVLNVAVATNNSDFAATEQGLQLTSEVIKERLERVATEMLAAERETTR
jgi:NAD(P)H-dependent FMN reductase/nucleoside-diphosphate-sugar epimerase